MGKETKTGWWFGTFFMSHILGSSYSQLTNQKMVGQNMAGSDGTQDVIAMEDSSPGK
jgi:hypothetical protein